MPRPRVPIPGDALAEITMADLNFETLLTDCPGQFWKADVVTFRERRSYVGEDSR